jgi:WLM domain
MQVWTFYLSPVYDSTMKNMCVKLDHGPDRSDMVITITGTNADQLFSPSIDWGLTVGLQRFSTFSNSASIALSKDEAAHGRVYSRTLYVDTDELCRILQIALNIDKQLARDRHVLPNNLNKEIAGVLQQLLQSHGAEAMLYVFEHISCRIRDNSKNELVRAGATVFKEPLRNYHAQLLECDPSKVLFHDGDFDSGARAILQQLGLHMIDNTGACGDEVDMIQLVTRLLAQSPTFKPTTQQEKLNVKHLNKYVECVNLNVNFKLQAIIKETNTMQQCRGDTRTGKVYLSCDLIKEPTCQDAALHVHSILMQWVGIDKHRFVAMLKKFMHNAEAFKPYKFDDELVFAAAAAAAAAATAAATAASAAASTAAAGASVPTSIAELSFARHGLDSSSSTNSSNSNNNVSSSSSTGVSSGGAATASGSHSSTSNVPYSDMHMRSSAPSASVRQCAFNGTVPQQFPPIQADQQHANQCMQGPRELVQETVHYQYEQYSVYIAKASHNTAIQRHIATARISSMIAHIDDFLQEIRCSIAQVLQIALADLPIIMIVCDNLLGFTHQGAVYVNIGPLLRTDTVITDYAVTQARCESLFFTVLHELAHRVHADHDTHFAGEFAKLTYACRKCLDPEFFNPKIGF